MLNINNSIQGLQKTSNNFNKSADRISKLGLERETISDEKLIGDIEDRVTLTNNNEVDVTSEFIKMDFMDVCYKANAKVIKTSDDILGTSIDIKA